MDNKELLDYRQRLLDRICSAAEEFRVVCESVKEPFKPLEVGGWSVHQLAAHVRDVDAQVYSLRVRRTFDEDHPTFKDFDESEWMRNHYNPKEPLSKILDEFVTGVNGLVEILHGVPNGAWNRLGRHVINGDRTLQGWAERGLAHIEEHLETVKTVR
jgi:hypothetical protein